MSINTEQTNKNSDQIVIRKKAKGLTYDEPGIPEWALREMEKGMGLPVSDSVVVIEQSNAKNEETEKADVSNPVSLNVQPRGRFLRFMFKVVEVKFALLLKSLLKKILH